MTDIAFELNSTNGMGRNPITQAGKVVYNGFKDHNLINIFKAQIRTGQNFYPGPTNDEDYSIQQREVVYSRRKGTNAKKGSMHVLSSVNAGFDKKDPLWKIISEHEIRGIAVTRSLLDSTGVNPEIDVVVQSGGLATVVNTGTRKINNGDSVYMEWPDPDKPYATQPRNSQKQLLWTMPLDPCMDALTESNIWEIMKDPATISEYERDINKPIVRSAINFKQFLLKLSVFAIHSALSAGIVTAKDIALEDTKRAKEQRRLNGEQYMSLDSVGVPKRKPFIKRLARLYGITDEEKKKLEVVFPQKLGKKQVVGDLADHVIETFSGKDNNFLVLPLQESGKMTSDEKKLVMSQQSLLADAFQAINEANEWKRGRVIGKALTPANPGEEFDMLLGRYTK